MIPVFNDIQLELHDRIVAASSQDKFTFFVFADGVMKMFIENAVGNLIMASTGDAMVPLYKHETEKVITVSAHPFINGFCAAGLTGGKLLLFNGLDKSIEVRDDLFANDVTMVKWLAHGRILVAADSIGKAIVMAFDPISRQI